MADDDQVSRADFERLAARLEDLADAQDELKAARTPAQRADARESIEDAEKQFRRLARQRGLDDDDIAAALKSKRKRELRELLDEIRAEDAANEPGDDADDDDADADADADDDDADGKATTVRSLKDAAAKRQAGKSVRAPKRPKVDEPPEGGAGEGGLQSFARKLLGS